MYLFDVNCAVGAWPTDRPLYETVGGLMSEMERLGIAQALVSHTLAQSYDPVQGNRLLIEALRGRERLHACWTLLPPSCNEMGTPDQVLAEMAVAGVRAVRLYPHTHSYALDDWQCGDLLAALSERRYVVLLDLAESNWSKVEHICRTCPDLSLVVTRTGYRQLRPLFALLARCANLYCDLSTFSTYLGVEEVLARFDSSRLLFGTGMPVSDPGGPIARIFYTDAPEADIDAMAHGNLERLLARVQIEGQGE